MDDKKCDEMLEMWATHEIEAAPQLRPTQEMYRQVKARKPKLWFPVFARWATVGVAVAAMVLIAVLHPGLFAPEKLLQAPQKKQELSQDQKERTTLNEQDTFQKKARVMDEALPESPPVEDNEEVAPLALQEEPALEELQDAQSRDKGAEETLLTDTGVARETELFMQRAMPAPSASPPSETKAPSSSASSTVRGKSLPQTRQVRRQSVRALSVPQTEAAAKMAEGVAGESPVPLQPAKTFRQQNGIWIDNAHTDKNELITIKRGSQAVDELLAALPDLAEYILPERHIIIAIGGYSIEIAESGKTSLTENELRLLRQAYKDLP